MTVIVEVCVRWVGLRNVRTSVLVTITTLVSGAPVKEVIVLVAVSVTIVVSEKAAAGGNMEGDDEQSPSHVLPSFDAALPVGDAQQLVPSRQATVVSLFPSHTDGERVEPSVPAPKSCLFRLRGMAECCVFWPSFELDFVADPV